MAARTNNDVEGWHNEINTKLTQSQKNFYLMLTLVHKEAVLVPILLRLISEDKLRRYQRKTLVTMQLNFFHSGRIRVWGAFGPPASTSELPSLWTTYLITGHFMYVCMYACMNKCMNKINELCTYIILNVSCVLC